MPPQKAACCDDFIARLEKGYDTPAGDAGKRLSGGEKQRIAIARAILKNAPIVILDEATAFTDPQNEDKIQKSIMALSKGKTLLVIAHRLSTIQNADQIVVLKKGQIVDCGKQGELLERCPLYADMWQAHIGAKNWSVGRKRRWLSMFKSMKRIIRWAGKYRGRLYLGSVFSFFSSLSTAIPTMAAAYALDKSIQAYWAHTTIDASLIWKMLWIIVGSIALNFLFSYLRAILQESIGYEVAAGQRIHLGDVLKRVPLGYFSQNSVGDILAGVTTELSTLELQGMKMVDVIINGYAKFIAIVLCLIFFSPVAAVISIVGVALSALALQGISRHSEKTAATTHKAMEDMSGAAIEYIRGLSIVKSFGQEGASIENFRNASKELKDIHIKVEKGYTPYNCLHLFVLKLASMGIVLVCAWQALQGQMSISVFLMFVLFSFVLFGSVENINDAAHTLGVIDSAMNKLEALENVNYIDQGGTDIKPATYDIEFRDVSFGYDSRIVLHDLNFKIPQNSTTAIVGPSGSGKSTLCNLIARFYDVNSGTITVGGTDIRRFTCDSLLKKYQYGFSECLFVPGYHQE